MPSNRVKKTKKNRKNSNVSESLHSDEEKSTFSSRTRGKKEENTEKKNEQKETNNLINKEKNVKESAEKKETDDDDDLDEAFLPLGGVFKRNLSSSSSYNSIEHIKFNQEMSTIDEPDVKVIDSILIFLIF